MTVTSPLALGVAAAVVLLAVIAFFSVRIAGKLGRPEPPEPLNLLPSQSAGYYKSYRFIYQKGEVPLLVAFQPQMLPRGKTVFVSATREIIKHCFDEEVSDDVERVGTEYVFSGPSHSFRVEPFLTDQGDIHAMVIAKEAANERGIR